MSDAASRALRRDAAHNRDRLVAAARTVFTDQGHDVALEEVARVAGVSRTTLYRNFTSREELTAVVAAEGVEQIERRAAELHADPWGALELFDFVLEQQLSNPAVTFFFLHGDPHFAEVAERTAASFRPLVDQAAQAGTLRAGVDLLDVLLALLMTELFLGEAEPGDRAERHRRGRRLLLRGLFTDEAVDAFLRRRETERSHPGIGPKSN